RKFEAPLERDPVRAVDPEHEIALRPVSHRETEDELLRIALDERLNERARLAAGRVLGFGADEGPLAEIARDFDARRLGGVGRGLSLLGGLARRGFWHGASGRSVSGLCICAVRRNIE